MEPLIAGALELLPQALKLAPQALKLLPDAVKLIPKVLPYLPTILDALSESGGEGAGTEEGSSSDSGGSVPGSTGSSGGGRRPRSGGKGNSTGSNSQGDGSGDGGKNKDCCDCGSEGGKDKKDAANAGPSISSSISLISDAVKSVSDSFTSTFVSAGQAVSSTASSIASGATSIVGAVGGSVTSAVSNVAGAITSLTASLGPVGTIIGGIASTVSAVTGAVVGLATGITTSIIAVGTAVLNTATTIATTVVSIVGNVVSTCSTFISTVSGLFTGASAALGVVGVVAAAVAGVLSGVANAITSVIGALASVVSGIVSAITSVVGALTSAFQSVSESLGALAGIAGQALSGFISAVQSSVESLISFAQNVSSIRDHTGMGLSQASDVTTDLQALGIASKETARIFGSIEMRPELFNARSNATGLAQLGPNFAVEEARLFQGLVKSIGYTAAKAHLDAQFNGQAPDSVLHMVNTDPAKLQANINYGRQIKSQLGVGPDQVKAASEDLPLLMDRISTFIEAVRTKFAAELLPALEGAFRIVSNVMANNAGNIANIIKTATYTIFVDGPDLAANAALTVLDWAQGLSDAFFALIDAGIEFARSFMDGQGPVFGVLLAGAQFIDSLVEFGAQFAGVAAAVGEMIKAAIVTMIPGGAQILQYMGIDPTLHSPTSAYDKAYNANHRDSGAVDWLQNTRLKYRKPVDDGLDKLEARKNDAKTKVDAGIDATRGLIKSAQAQAGTRAERAKMMQDNSTEKESLDVQKAQLAVSKEHLGVARSAQGCSSGQVVARMGAYLAQDAYRLTSR